MAIGLAAWRKLFPDGAPGRVAIFARCHAMGLNDSAVIRDGIAAPAGIGSSFPFAALHGSVSRTFAKPKSGTITLKAATHLDDRVMKVFGVGRCQFRTTDYFGEKAGSIGLAAATPAT